MFQKHSYKLLWAVVLINVCLVIGFVVFLITINFFNTKGVITTEIIPPFIDVTDPPVYKTKPAKEIFQIEKNGKHPCNRECIEGGEPLNCYYHFELELYQSLSKACFNCPSNLTDCYRTDCIPIDGVCRTINVVNRKFPGPAIEVCQYDRIIVDVLNDLMSESTTIHWHGYHQRGTPYMDGVPHITQCPIPPATTFRYDFKAIHSGTHFYHGHSGVQRSDGLVGALIVRKPKSLDNQKHLYDYDRPEHLLMVTEWIHDLTSSFYIDQFHARNERHNKLQPVALINGWGRPKNDIDGDKFIPPPRFNVEKGKKYRFRVINSDSMNCPMEITVDNHNITVIATDGYNLQPITATSLVTYAGERYDFIIDSNQNVGNYWIKIRADGNDCGEKAVARTTGVLHYEGASDQNPGPFPSWKDSHSDGLQSNPKDKGEEDDETICVSKMRSVAGYDDSLKAIPDQVVYISYNFYGKDSAYHRPPYSFDQALTKSAIPQFNYISMKMPSSALMVAKPPSETFCNSSTVNTTCVEGSCHCTHVVSLKLNDVVEIIFVDNGHKAYHPIHLHGHSFRVLEQRSLGGKISLEKIKALDKEGLLNRNLQNSPIKDTNAAPGKGYSIIRFKADNPGYWFLDHWETHTEMGMGMVVKVGEHIDMPPLPKGFPTCGDYIPS